MKIEILYYQNYYKKGQKISKFVEKKMMNSKGIDVLLIETAIPTEDSWFFWTDIFAKKLIGKEVREKIEDKGIRIIDLIGESVLGWQAKKLMSFSVFVKAEKIKKILEAPKSTSS